LSEQVEIWLDRIGHVITEPAHGDRLARTIAALEDMAALAALIPFSLDVNVLVAATRTSRACGVRSAG
jgi:hypothetical protein